jgi:hypothetical protein
MCAEKKIVPKKSGPQKPSNKFSQVCPNQKWATKKSKRSHFNAASINFSKKKSENSPPSWVCPKRKVKKIPKMCPNTKLKKNKTRISSPVFASHP